MGDANGAPNVLLSDPAAQAMFAQMRAQSRAAAAASASAADAYRKLPPHLRPKQPLVTPPQTGGAVQPEHAPQQQQQQQQQQQYLQPGGPAYSAPASAAYPSSAPLPAQGPTHSYYPQGQQYLQQQQQQVTQPYVPTQLLQPSAPHPQHTQPYALPYALQPAASAPPETVPHFQYQQQQQVQQQQVQQQQPQQYQPPQPPPPQQQQQAALQFMPVSYIQPLELQQPLAQAPPQVPQQPHLHLQPPHLLPVFMAPQPHAQQPVPQVSPRAAAPTAQGHLHHELQQQQQQQPSGPVWEQVPQPQAVPQWPSPHAPPHAQQPPVPPYSQLPQVAMPSTVPQPAPSAPNAQLSADAPLQMHHPPPGPLVSLQPPPWRTNAQGTPAGQPSSSVAASAQALPNPSQHLHAQRAQHAQPSHAALPLHLQPLPPAHAAAQLARAASMQPQSQDAAPRASCHPQPQPGQAQEGALDASRTGQQASAVNAPAGAAGAPAVPLASGGSICLALAAPDAAHQAAAVARLVGSITACLYDGRPMDPLHKRLRVRAVIALQITLAWDELSRLLTASTSVGSCSSAGGGAGAAGGPAVQRAAEQELRHLLLSVGRTPAQLDAAYARLFPPFPPGRGEHESVAAMYEKLGAGLVQRGLRDTSVGGRRTAEVVLSPSASWGTECIRFLTALLEALRPLEAAACERDAACRNGHAAPQGVVEGAEGADGGGSGSAGSAASALAGEAAGGAAQPAAGGSWVGAESEGEQGLRVGAPSTPLEAVNKVRQYLRLALAPLLRNGGKPMPLAEAVEGIRKVAKVPLGPKLLAQLGHQSPQDFLASAFKDVCEVRYEAGGSFTLVPSQTYVHAPAAQLRGLHSGQPPPPASRRSQDPPTCNSKMYPITLAQAAAAKPGAAAAQQGG